MVPSQTHHNTNVHTAAGHYLNCQINPVLLQSLLYCYFTWIDLSVEPLFDFRKFLTLLASFGVKVNSLFSINQFYQVSSRSG